MMKQKMKSLKIRRENAPDTLKQLFYAFGITLDDAFERIVEYENNSKIK